MKIISLTAENIKRLTAVTITPEGNLVEITGRNAQGKTSVLDSIWMALGGDKAISEKPIRDGADKGTISIDLGDYKVVRTFKAKEDGSFTKSITVTNVDGFKAGNPQEILNGLVGNLTFDPLQFARMKTEDQVKALRSLVPDFDFAANDKAVKEAFDTRTSVNRRVAQLKAQLAASPAPEGAPEEPVSLSDLTTELQQALDHNTRVEKAERAKAQHENEIEETRQEIADLKTKLKEKESYLEELLDVELGDIPARKSIEEIQSRIQDCERLNALHARRKAHEQLAEELRAEEEVSADLTQKVEAGRKAAADAVRSAQLPIEGLELTEDSILLNGQPFSQASDAEQLRASVAIAGAMNPRLRIIRVRDGSLLDPESMALLAEYAEANDMQVWVETVASGRQAAVVIEDGHVVGQVAEAAE